jgi:hypothetical protein
VARGDTAAAEVGADDTAAEVDAADARADADEAGEAAEEAGDAGGAEDDPPDEHPAAVAARAATDAAPPSLSHNEAEPNITNHLLLMTGMSANARTRECGLPTATTSPKTTSC